MRMSRRHHGRFDSIDFHDISPRRQPTGPKEAGTAAASKTSGSDSDTAAGIGIGPASLPGPGRLLGLLKLNCLLGCVGAVTGLLSTIINMSIFILAVTQDYLARLSPTFLLVSMALDLTFLALAAALCKHFAATAIGSGVAQMKFVLAGEVVPAARRFFAFSAGAVKVLGIVLVVAGRLNVGREGAMAQIAGCIAFFLARQVPFFRDVSRTVSQQRQLYAASAAVGIATAFHAPIGGVLFSIEVTATFYLVSNYWKAFVASISGMLCVELLQSTVREGYILPTTVVPVGWTESLPDPPVSAYHSAELLIFALIGGLGGLLGCLLLRVFSLYRTLVTPWSKHRPLLLTTATGLVTLLVLRLSGIYFRSFRFSREGLFQYDFLKLDFLSSPDSHHGNSSGSERSALAFTLLAISQTFLTIIGTNCPVPTGSFFPMFIVGACLGRIVAQAARELEDVMNPGGRESHVVGMQEGATVAVHYLFVMARSDPMGYAIVGGVALTASVTQAISCAVIAIEITDDISYLLPCLLTAVIASGISKVYGLSIYERTMEDSELETLPILLTRSLRLPAAPDAPCSLNAPGDIEHHPAPSRSNQRRSEGSLKTPVQSSAAAGGFEVGVDELSRRVYAQHPLVFVHEHSCVAEFVMLLGNLLNLVNPLCGASSREEGSKEGVAQRIDKHQHHLPQHHQCRHFAVVDTPLRRRLTGDVARGDVTLFLRKAFTAVGLSSALRLLLSAGGAGVEDDLWPRSVKEHTAQHSGAWRGIQLSERALDHGGLGGSVTTSTSALSSSSNLQSGVQKSGDGCADSSDSDSRAFLNLGLCKSASMPALSEAQKREDKRGGDYNFWRNRYGTRSDVSPPLEHAHSPRSTTSTSSEAGSAMEHCWRVLASHHADELVDWEYLERHVATVLTSSSPPCPTEREVAEQQDQLAEALKEEIPELSAVGTGVGEGCTEGLIDDLGQENCCCASAVASTLLALLRSRVHLSPPASHSKLVQGTAESSPIFSCPPAPTSVSAPLHASIWPSPAEISRTISRLSPTLSSVVRRSPFSIPAFMPLEELCILSEMLQSAEQFVTHRGELVGVVTREGLLATLRDTLAEREMQRDAKHGRPEK